MHTIKLSSVEVKIMISALIKELDTLNNRRWDTPKSWTQLDDHKRNDVILLIDKLTKL